MKRTSAPERRTGPARRPQRASRSASASSPPGGATALGFADLPRQVRITRQGRTVPVVLSLSGSVAGPSGGLPAPDVGVLIRATDRIIQKNGSIDSLAAGIAKALLAAVPPATEAEAALGGTYFLERTIPSGRGSLEPYRLLARATATRGPGKATTLHREIGVEVVGISACPCAMEVVRELMHMPPGPPMPTHSQRNRTAVHLGGDGPLDVDVDDLIQLIEESQSAPTFELLKRGDEGRLVYDAHLKPRFVEDVVREVLHRLVERFPGLPASVQLSAKSTSEESIHKHDAFAERRTTLGELRRSAVTAP